jgi:putative transposon-encoded protein
MTEELIIKKTNKDGELNYFKATKKIKKIGSGGYVLLPKELIGQYLKMEWKKE